MKPQIETASLVWLTVQQAANRAQCGEKLLYRAVRRREIRHVKLNGRGDLRFRPVWVDDWLESHSQPIGMTVTHGAQHSPQSLSLRST